MGNEVIPSLESTKKHKLEKESETDSDSEGETDNRWKNMDLKSLGIRLNFSSKLDAEAVAKNKLGTWSVEKRNNNLHRILTENGEFNCSDIYEVGGKQIQTKEDVTVTVTLGKDLSPKRHKVMVKRSVDGSWETMEAELLPSSLRKRCKAVFRTRQLKEFVIIGRVKVAKVKVSPAGTKVKVDVTSKMAVDIPAGAVDNDQDMDFQIIPPDQTAIKNYLHGDNPFCKSVVGVTECLYGDSKTALTFKKPVTVQLPLEKKSKEGETLVLFRMVGNEAKMMNRDTRFSLSTDNVCNLEVSSFSGYCAVTVRQGAEYDVKSIENDVRLLYGMNSLAKILVFREREVMVGARFPRVWVELVDKIRVEHVVKMRTNEGGLVELPNSRSPDLKVKNNFKLKYELTGGIKGDRDIPKSFYLITYMEVSDDNHNLFPVEVKEVGRLGIINFFNGKDCVHSVQMDIQGFDRAVQQTIRPSSSVSSQAVGDHLSMGSERARYASRSSIGNDGAVGGATGFQRQASFESIGSATSLVSVSQQCKALNDSSLFVIANKLRPEDGAKLSEQLGMADVFDNISQDSQSERQAIFKLLKEWAKVQIDLEEARKCFTKGLKSAKLARIEKAFQKALKNNSEVSEKDMK